MEYTVKNMGYIMTEIQATERKKTKHSWDKTTIFPNCVLTK